MSSTFAALAAGTKFSGQRNREARELFSSRSKLLLAVLCSVLSLLKSRTY